MLSDQHSHAICTGITPPGAQEDQPHQEFSVRKISCKINKGKHHSHINNTKESRHYLLCRILWICKYIYKHKEAVSLFFYLFVASSSLNNSSHLLSTSFWNSSIIHSFPGLNICLNLFCGLKNSSIGSLFFGL